MVRRACFERSNKTSLIACVHRSHHSTTLMFFLTPQGILEGGWIWVWIIEIIASFLTFQIPENYEAVSFAHLLSSLSRKCMVRCAYKIYSITSLCCRHFQKLPLVLMALSKKSAKITRCLHSSPLRNPIHQRHPSTGNQDIARNSVFFSSCTSVL